MSLGAVPRYVDVAPGSPNMDAADLAKKITASTRAVVVQHSFGLPADIERLGAMARQAGVPVIEDCAHTIASTVNGRRVGTFGVAAFFSYEASKPVFVGVGGSAMINDSALADAVNADYATYSEPSRFGQAQIAAMRLAHRVTYRPSTYWKVRSVFRAVSKLGLIRGNYNKISDEQGPAADFSTRMGRAQVRILERELRRLDANTDHRRRVASAYRSGIRRDGIEHLPIPANVDPVFGRYPLIADDRPALIEGAKRAKVELADFYATAVHPLRGNHLREVSYEPGSCVNAEWLSERIVSLPTGKQVDQRQIDRAVDYLNG
jgi:dTDP-4-amino-4,6-dideoxygalactose transaminase